VADVPFRKIIPTLRVRDVAATLVWYRDTLGFKVEGQQGDVFGSVTRGFGRDAAAVNIYFLCDGEPIQPALCYVLVDEVDDLCREFRARGATIVEEPADRPWGYRQFLLEDLNGHRFYFFRFLEA